MDCSLSIVQARNFLEIHAEFSPNMSTVHLTFVSQNIFIFNLIQEETYIVPQLIALMQFGIYEV
jgi:hypothetical protein